MNYSMEYDHPLTIITGTAMRITEREREHIATNS
jgi:hypothetical protein